jgi:hypothetical protein
MILPVNATSLGRTIPRMKSPLNNMSHSQMLPDCHYPVLAIICKDVPVVQRVERLRAELGRGALAPKKKSAKKNGPILYSFYWYTL